jgi:hypothetical protein
VVIGMAYPRTFAFVAWVRRFGKPLLPGGQKMSKKEWGFGNMLSLCCIQ